MAGLVRSSIELWSRRQEPATAAAAASANTVAVYCEWSEMALLFGGMHCVGVAEPMAFNGASSSTSVHVETRRQSWLVVNNLHAVAGAHAACPSHRGSGLGGF